MDRVAEEKDDPLARIGRRFNGRDDEIRNRRRVTQTLVVTNRRRLVILVLAIGRRKRVFAVDYIFVGSIADGNGCFRLSQVGRGVSSLIAERGTQKLNRNQQKPHRAQSAQILFSFNDAKNVLHLGIRFCE